MKKFSFVFAAAFAAGMVGLSAQAAEKELIPYSSAMTATASIEHSSGRGAIKAINGAGLNADGQHSTTDTDSWMAQSSSFPSGGIWYRVDLGETYWLSSIKVWNYNYKAERGAKETDIYYSTAENPAGSTSPSSDWTLLRTVEMEKATGAATYTGMDPIDFDPVRARFVLFHIKSVWSNYGGLSEVQFFSMSPFGDCSLTKVRDGEFEFVGSVEGVDASDVKLVFSADGQEDVEVDLGPQTAGAVFEETVTKSHGFLDTCLYRAKLVSTTAAGVNELDFPSTYYFGSAPKVVDFMKKIDFALSDEAKAALGESVVAEVPVAIRVSTSIPGFDYGDMNEDGTDVIFGSVDGGEITRYPFEVEMWNPVGESVFWVKVPSLSAATTISMCYGNDVFVPDNIPTDVWSDYAVVFHGNTFAEATGKGIAGSAGSDKVTATAASGWLGGGFNKSTCNSIGLNFTNPVNAGALSSINQLTVSGWYRPTLFKGESTTVNSGILAANRKSWGNDGNGFMWLVEAGTYLSFTVGGAHNGSKTEGLFWSKDSWSHFAATYDNKAFANYCNGVLLKSGTTGNTIDARTANSWTFGGYAMTAASDNFCGDMDELRVYNGAASADYLKAEYLVMLPGFLDAGAAEPIDETAPVFEAPVVTVSASGDVSVSITVTSGEGDVYLMVDDEKVEPKLGTIGDEITIGTPIVAQPIIAANACASIAAYGINAKGTEVVKKANGGVMNAAVVAAVAKNAQELGLGVGQFSIARAEGAANDANLIVNLSWSGSAVAGKNYVDNLPESVTIPAGEDSMTIEVTPLIDRDSATDTELTLTIAGGAYISGASAAMTILHLVAPAEYNTWIAVADGLASDESNWSKGVPQSDHKILFDPQFSNANCEWDGGVNGLATSVAEWTQAEGFTGTVTIPTTFPTYANSTFKTFTVTGAMTIDGGMLTHPQSVDLPNDNTTYTLSQIRSKYTYRLCLAVGSLTIGAGGKINAQGKGHRQSPTTSGGRCPAYVTAHGGRYDNSSFACYGNVKYPEDIGMAGGSGTDGGGSKHTAGGGAVKITSNGACVINGEISADGTASSGMLTTSAAGSILIEAPSVSGSGSIHADGCYSGNNSYRNGAGGRVALLTTTPVDTDALTISAGSSGSGKYGAEGTVYLKDSTMTDGVLYLNNPLYTSSNSTPGMGAYVTNEEGVDWRFDGIKLNGHVNLYVPAGTTLTLPNGFASVSAPDNVSRVSGIYYRGGTIDVGSGNQTIGNGHWYFFPSSNYVFSANLTVGGNAAIGGCGYWEQSIANNAAPTAAWKTLFEVVGDMTVSADGVVTADTMGLGQQSGTQYEGIAIGAHGGRRSADGKTMDSVFKPHVCAVYQQNSYSYVKGGGVIDFTVGGCLMVDGNIHSDSHDTGDSQRGNASGGAINIQAGSIAGAGTISASAKRDTQCGGRVAIKLTDSGSTFDAFTGSIRVNGGGSSSSSSAGSIYLQDGDSDDKCGLIRIDNNSKDGLFTPICATGYEADSVADFKNAKLVLSNKGYAQVAVADDGKFRLASIDIDATSKLDLNGNTLTVIRAKLGDTKLAVGTYATNDPAVADFVTDSVGGGSLVVKGEGLRLILR